LLPIQTATGASKTFANTDFFKKTRRSNSGSAMTDTLPASSTTGLVNGTRINIVNVDATASDTITAGSGTTIAGGSSYVIPAGRDIMWVYDLANTAWRADANTGSAALITGTLTPGNVPVNNTLGTGISDSGVALLTSLPATSVWGNNSSSTAPPAALTTLMLANGSCSAPTYSFNSAATSGLAVVSTDVSMCVGGNRLIDFSTASTSTNYIQFSAASIPAITAKGTNIQLQVGGTGTGGLDVLNGSNYIVRFFGASGTPVNYATITNAVTGSPALLNTAGGDTNVGLTIGTKGTGTLTVSPATVMFTGITVTPTGKQPLCIDTSTKQVYFGSAGAC
jgi:hypothetical protein